MSEKIKASKSSGEAWQELKSEEFNAGSDRHTSPDSSNLAAGNSDSYSPNVNHTSEPVPYSSESAPEVSSSFRYEKIVSPIFEQKPKQSNNLFYSAKTVFYKLFSRTTPEDETRNSQMRDEYRKRFLDSFDDWPNMELDEAAVTKLAKLENNALNENDFNLAHTIMSGLWSATRLDIPLLEAANYAEVCSDISHSRKLKKDESKHRAMTSIADAAFRNRGLNDNGVVFLQQEVLPIIGKTKPDTLGNYTHIFKAALKNFDGSPEQQSRLRQIKQDLLPMAAHIDDSRFKMMVLASAAQYSTDVDAVHKNSEFIKQRVFPIIEQYDSDLENFCQLTERTFENPELQPFYENTILPKLQQNDPSLGFLTHRQYVRGEARIHNYDLDCLTTKNTPLNLNHLLQEHRGLPTSNINKLEQNRIDALAIERVVIDEHGFIHDEAPETHDLISAMVKYYDSQDSQSFSEAQANLQTIVERCESQENNARGYGKLSRFVFNLNNYDFMIDREVRDDFYTVTYNEPVINILRRLQENTNPENLTPPSTDDQKLNQLLEKIRPHRRLENHTILVDWYEVGDLATYMNQHLSATQGEYGFLPNMVEAIAYTEKMATYAMRNITEKQRQELVFDPVFREIVRFNQLTATYDKYSPAEFERFWSGFTNISLEDPASLQGRYARLQMRILGQLKKLSRYYKESREPQLAASLQSGNLSHELIGLTERRSTKFPAAAKLY